MSEEEYLECSVVAYPRQIKFLHINGRAISYCVDRHISDYVDRLQQENQELKADLEMYENGVYFSSEVDEKDKEIDKLKKQLENKYSKIGTITNEVLYEENTKLINQQKEFISYLENEINICDCFLDTVKSCLRNTPYTVMSSIKKYITTLIKENEIEHKVYKEILQKYKSIIGASDDKTN